MKTAVITRAGSGMGQAVDDTAIPKGLFPPAQGWRPSAYLGYSSSSRPNRKAVVATGIRSFQKQY
jgi:hypothetical protein